jgi:putative peptidoglycan lipid II flippase
MKIFKAIEARFLKADLGHQAIATGMASVVLFVFVGKLAGAAKEMVVAFRYGVSEEVDAYLFVFNLVSWPVSVWFSVLTVVLVPLAARLRHESKESIAIFRAELLGLTILIGAAFTVLFWLILPSLFRFSWLGLSSSTSLIAIKMVPELGGLIFFGFLASLFSAWMLSARRHANTLLEGVPSVAILSTLLIIPVGGIAPLVWGTLIGFALHLISLAIPLAKSREIEIPKFARNSRHWRVFWQGFGIMMVGQMLMSLVGIVDQFFASHLGTGAISSLSYANRLLALVLGLGATAISRATLPVFSQAQNQQGEDNHNLASYWMKALFIFGVVTIIIGWWLAPFGVKLLFQRGAFTANNTEVVTEIFRYGLLQLPFYFSGLVLVSHLSSQGKYKSIATIAASNLPIKVVLNFLLIPSFGMIGLMISTGLMLFSSMVMCWIAVRHAKLARL